MYLDLRNLEPASIGLKLKFESGNCSGLNLGEEFLLKGIDPDAKFLMICLLPENLHFNIRYDLNTIFKII